MNHQFKQSHAPVINYKSPSLSRRALVGPVLIIFACGFFVVFAAYNLSTFARTRFASVLARPNEKSRPVVTSANISIESLLPEPIYVGTDFFDVFADRAKVSHEKFAAITSNQTALSAPISKQQAEVINKKPDFYQRYSSWQRLTKMKRELNQPTPPVESVYSIEDMESVGSTSGKKGREALIYIGPEERVISVGVGTRFFDSELIEISAEGPRFRTANGEVKTLGWSRNPKEPASKKETRQQENTKALEVACPTCPKPEIKVKGQEFELLQEAARDRYRKSGN